MIRSYIGLITEDNMPFHILNSKNMKNIIDPICQGIKQKTGNRFALNGGKCKNVLQQVANNIRKRIKDEIRMRMISLKVDCATRLSRNVFGVGAQFIKNSTLEKRILGMIELKG